MWVCFTTVGSQLANSDTVLIHVYGTSHVSQESLDLVEQKIEEHDPEIVALELDYMRLNGLLSGEKRSGGPVFIRLIQMFQKFIGQKTGVMPGEEMLYAYRKAVEEGRDIALIDQDIRDTVQGLKEVRTTEKIKVGAQLLIGLPFGGGFNVSEIPEDKLIDRLLTEMSFKFPDLYKVLVEDRNTYMTHALKQLQENNPEEDIVAFVGAAHKKEIQKALEEDEISS